jgi:peptidoglycan/LPS O-acetylase OafA/YrhL
MIIDTPIATPPTSAPATVRPSFDIRLEGLRGLAALTVVLGHIIVIKQALDPHYQPTGIFSFQAPGHLSVIIFFILSGYVIGLTNKKPLTKNGIGLYLKKRFVRIYPIYIVSIALALVLSPPLPAETIAGNFSFLQVLATPVIAANSPIWSLHYEILFYLLFIPVSLLRLPATYVCAGSFLAGLGLLFFSTYSGAPLLTSYLFGFSLWSLGLVLVDVSRHDSVHYSSSQLVSAFLLFFSLERTNQLQTVFTKVYKLFPAVRWEYPEKVEWAKRAIALVDFSYLPYCFLMMVIFTNRSFPFRKYITILLYILPAYVLIYIYHNAEHYQQMQAYAIPVCSYLLSILVLLLSRAEITERLSDKFIFASIKLGALSYGLYVIHFPILLAFRNVDFFSGTWFTFVVRCLLFIAISIFCSYLLEKRLQPLVKRLFFK